jgi:transposase
VRAHQHAAGASKKNGEQGLGRSRGGLSTKIHAAVDGLGNITRFRLTGGERHDITEAENLIEGMENVGVVVADKAFDANSLLDCISAMEAPAVIPPKANRKEIRGYDRHVYKSRNLIERFFARIKQFRRIATRYDKLAVRFEAFISITAAFIWLA